MGVLFLFYGMGQKKNNKEIPLWLQFQDKGIHLDDYVDTRNFLKSIGYDTSRDIHLQFCEKYGLDKPTTGIGRPRK